LASRWKIGVLWFRYCVGLAPTRNVNRVGALLTMNLICIRLNERNNNAGDIPVIYAQTARLPFPGYIVCTSGSIHHSRAIDEPGSEHPSYISYKPPAMVSLKRSEMLSNAPLHNSAILKRFHFGNTKHHSPEKSITSSVFQFSHCQASTFCSFFVYNPRRVALVLRNTQPMQEKRKSLYHSVG
jgi:hypothetical protein